MRARSVSTVQSNSWLPIAAASIPSAFSAAIAGRPKLKLETGVPCISSPASSRIVVQKHPRARLSSHGLSAARSEEHTSELQSLAYLVCRLLLEKKKKKRHHL